VSDVIFSLLLRSMVFSSGKCVFEESFGLIGGNKKAQIVAKNIAEKNKGI